MSSLLFQSGAATSNISMNSTEFERVLNESHVKVTKNVCITSTIQVDNLSKTDMQLWQNKSMGRLSNVSGIEVSIIESSISSLRNCSSILHASTSSLYKTSPAEANRRLLRQTSTPMHQNVMIINTSDSFISSASSMSQMSSIHNSVESESDLSQPSAGEREL